MTKLCLTVKKIDEMGGAVVAIEKGYIQKEIQESAYKLANWKLNLACAQSLA